MEDNPDFESLPIEDRLAHKVWKARLSAYEALIQQFRTSASEEDPCFSPYLSNPDLLKKAALDANAVAQEKAVAAICAFVEFGGKQTAQTRDVVMPAVVEKCLGSARAGTKGQAIELAQQYTEAAGSAEGVATDIIASLKAKQPKLVSGCVTALKELVKNFGPKIVPIQLVLKQLPQIFGHADKTVRAEGSALVQETYRFIGPAVEAFFNELKTVQVKELQESFAALDDKGEGKGTAKQLRFTKDQQRENAIREAETTLGGGEQEAEDQGGAAGEQEEKQEFDAYSLAEPVDIRKKIPADFHDKLASTKWKERKEEALDPLLAQLSSTPKVADEDYADIIAGLAKRMTDSNVACVTVAAQCIAAFANGLRADFAKYKSTVTAPVLERLKEKKQSVVDALASALDATAQSVPLSDFVEDITTFAVHKNPQVKCETFRFLVRLLKTTKKAPAAPEVKTLSATQLKGMEDSFEPVRAAAMEGLGTLAKIVGERPLVKELDGLDDIKKGKVKEFMEKAEVKCKGGLGAPAAAKPPPAPAAAPVSKGPPAQKPKPKTTPAAAPAQDSATAPSESVPTSARPPPGARKPPASKTAPPANAPVAKKPAAKPAAAAAPPPKATAVPSEPLRYRMTQEDADARAPEVLPAEIYAGLGDSNWKTRLAAVEGLHAWLEGEGSETEAELVARTLSKRPGWKESNFQVFNKVFSVARMLAESSPSWTKACSAIFISPATDKLGDIKIKGTASELLLDLAEKSSLQFVLSHAYDPMTKQKAPKAQAEALGWIDQALKEFGSAGISVRDLIECLKTGLKSSNPTVRSSATKSIVTLKMYIGPAVKDFIQDLNPQLLGTIDKEFTRVEGESPPEPVRTSADLAAPSAGDAGGAKGGSGASGAAAADPMDELYPRVDLAKILSSSVLTSCNDANWKTRKESMEQVQAALESNKRYKPGIGDLGGVLKMRLGDSNKVVQSLTLDILTKVASGMNKPFDRHVKTLAPPTMQVLADQKAGTRAAGTSSLTAMAEACGLDTLVSSVAGALDTQNPVLRKELLTWFSSQVGECEATLDLAILTSPLLSCLEDRSADVRKAASNILPHLIASAGYERVADKASSLKPASRTTILPMIEGLKGSTASAPPSAPHAGPSSPPSKRPMSPAIKRAPAEPAPARVRPASSLGTSISRPVSAVNKSLRASGAGSRPMTPSRPASTDPGASEGPARARTLTGIRKPASMAAPKTPAKSLMPSASAATPSTSKAAMPLTTTDAKYKLARASKEIGPLRWSVEGLARPEQVETLHHQMGPHVSNEILQQLFSKDHHCEKDYLAALSALDACAADPEASAEDYSVRADELVQGFVANVDLVFKYLSIRLADSGTTIIIKCFDLASHLIDILSTQSYFLSDYEMNCLLPALISKSGDAKEVLRHRVKDLIRQSCTVYPASKVFAAILDHGIKSKNARTRAESADDLAMLIQRHGADVFNPAKALPIIGGLVADRDSTARSAAISTVAIIYNLQGDAIFDYLQGLSPKERGILDERLKRTPSQKLSPPRPPTSSSTVPQSLRKGPRPMSSRMSLGGAPAGRIPPPLSLNGHRPTPAAEQRQDETDEAAASSIARPRSKVQPITALAQAAPQPVTSGATPKPITFDSIVDEDSASSVDALKTVQKDIDHRASEVMPMADDLVRAVTLQMKTAFDAIDPSISSANLRLCKHLMQTLSSFVENRSLAREVSKEALIGVIAELTRRLLETADNPDSEAIVSLSKVLNMVLIRIFHNTDRSVCFGALFTVLEDITVDLRELDGRDLQQRAKYAELVMKCLWKISKSAKDSLDDGSLNLKRLLVDLDSFLTAIPPAEWRRRAADGVALGDMPLRTCKTILQQVVTVHGRRSLEELESMGMTDTSFVGAYLQRLVQGSSGPTAPEPSSRSAPAPTDRRSTAPRIPDTKKEEQVSPKAPANESDPASSPDEREVNQQLKEIFDTIGQPETSKQGVTVLWEFRQHHPEAEQRIQTWIDGTGKHFKQYLERTMKNISNDRGVPSKRTSATSSRPHSESAFAAPARVSSKPTASSPPHGSSGERSRATSPSDPSSERLANLQSLFGYGAGPTGSPES